MVEQLRSISRKVVVQKEKLKREIGVAALFSAGYGNVGSSIYYALGATTVYALGASPLVILLAGIFFIFTVWSFTEGTSMMPFAGGASYFSRKGINESVSFFTGWIDLLTYIVTISISAYTAVKYLAYFVPFLAKPIPIMVGTYAFSTDPHLLSIIVAVLFVLGLMALNVSGVKEATAFNIFFAVLDILTQGLLIILGILLVLNLKKIFSYPSMGPEFWPTWKGFIQGFAIAMISYTGIDTISQMSEEAYDYKRTIPRAYLLLIIVVLVMSVGLPVIAASVMDPAELAGKWAEDPIAGIAFYMPDISFFGITVSLKSILGPWVAILAVSILLMATNAGIMGASRLAYSMGEFRQLPDPIFKLHRKYNTPYMAIIVFSSVSALLLLLGIFSRDIFLKLASLYAFSAMLIFTMAHISIIALRIKKPDMERPYKIRWNFKYKKSLIPITCVFGVVVNIIVWFVIATGDMWTTVVGMSWIIIGYILYVLYRKQHNLPIHEEASVERVIEGTYQPVDFYDIIVPTVGGLEADMMQAACKIALRDKSKILAIYVIEVPMTLPVNAAIPAEKEKGEEALDQAEMIAKEYDVPIDTKLIQTRAAGKAIVEEAIRRKSDLIMMGQPDRTSSSEVLNGKTVSYVSKNAPCKVWINISEKN